MSTTVPFKNAVLHSIFVHAHADRDKHNNNIFETSFISSPTLLASICCKFIDHFRGYYGYLHSVCSTLLKLCVDVNIGHASTSVIVGGDRTVRFVQYSEV